MPTLHWLTRDTDIHAAARVPYRLLEEAPDLSTGDPDAGNMLIQGDNLEALKALLPFYAGQGLWCMKTVGAVLPLVWCVLDFLGYRIGLGLSQMQ